MNILTTTEHIFEFWFFLMMIGTFTLFVLIMMSMFWFFMITEKDFTFDTITPTIVFTLFFLLLSYSLVTTVNDGARITYDVTVSDWNEVYDQGYKVVKQDGNIVTIELKDK